MRPLKLLILVLLFCGFLATAFIASLGIPLMRLPRLKITSALMRRFNAILRTLLNIKIDLQGSTDSLQREPHFIVSNHHGYLDGIVLGSLFPVVFLTKRQVKRWPVIGQLMTLLGTFFIDRENKQDVLRIVTAISESLKEGTNVLVFPEGTSTNGDKLLPFQSALFAAPIIARAAITPVTLGYRFVDQEPLSVKNRDRVYWYGDMSFAPHLWDLLGTTRIDVSVKIHADIDTCLLENNSRARKQVSQVSYGVIARREIFESNKSPEALQLFPEIARRHPS